MLKKLFVCLMSIALLMNSCLMVTASDSYEDSPISLQDFMDQAAAFKTDNNIDETEEEIIETETTTESEVSLESGDLQTVELNTNETVTENDSSDFLYVVNDGETYIKAYNGSSENVVIPAEIDGGIVTTIGDKAFADNRTIHSVIFPDTVKSIGSYAFNSCTNLKKVVFPSDTDYLSIGELAFSQAGIAGELVINIKSVDIGAHAFSHTDITKLIILSDDITFRDAPFNYSSLLKTVYIKPDANAIFVGDYVNSKEGDVFAYLDSLEDIYLPAECEFLTENTFESTPNVIVYVPEGSSIVDYANSLWLPTNTVDYEEKASEVLEEVSQINEDISDTGQNVSETAEADQENETVEETESESEHETETEITTEKETQLPENDYLTASEKNLTGTIIEATMNSITIQTDDGETYSCSTENTAFDLTNGIVLGLEVEVTLDNETSNEYGVFDALKVEELPNDNTVNLEAAYEDEIETESAVEEAESETLVTEAGTEQAVIETETEKAAVQTGTEEEGMNERANEAVDDAATDVKNAVIGAVDKIEDEDKEIEAETETEKAAVQTETEGEGMIGKADEAVDDAAADIKNAVIGAVDKIEGEDKEIEAETETEKEGILKKIEETVESIVADVENKVEETEEETEDLTEKLQESTELTAPSDTLEGIVTDVDEDTGDGETIVLKTDDGTEYTIFIDEAEWDLDSRGLEKGIYVAVILQDTTATDGYFVATEIKETGDLNVTTEAPTIATSSDGLVATGTDLKGYVYDADGRTLILDGDDGNEYSIYYADAAIDAQADNLSDGTYCVIMIADVNPSADGNLTALDVKQLPDPSEELENTTENTEADVSDSYIEGVVTYIDGDTITVDTGNGDPYDFLITDASMDLDIDELYEGMVVSVTFTAPPDTDGLYEALNVTEAYDPEVDETESQTSALHTEGTITVGGVVTGIDGDTMTVDAADGDTYDFLIANAEMDLDDNGLYEGIAVTVTSATPPDADGLYEALNVTETDDPEVKETEVISASSLYLTGYIYGADGSILLLDSDDGNEYSIYYADAYMDDVDNNLSDGTYSAISLTDVTPAADGNLTALNIELLEDPSETRTNIEDEDTSETEWINEESVKSSEDEDLNIKIYPELDEEIKDAIVKECYETIKDQLLAPDSMIIYDCYGEYSQSDEVNFSEYGKDLDYKQYDMYTVYFYIGAMNRMGGITDEQYVFICDLSGNILDYCTGSERDEMMDSDDYGYHTSDLIGQWLNVDVATMFFGFGDSWTDYKDYIQSEEFDSLDYEEVLNNIPEDYGVIEPIE